MYIKAGATDITTYFVLRDDVNHKPKTDITITDIDLYYQRDLQVQSAKADATALAAADSPHGDNKAYHCGNGLYRIDWADTAFAGAAGTKVTLIVVCKDVDTTYLDVELIPEELTAGDVWDELLAGHTIVGSAGAVLSSAGSAADPLLNIVPGSYLVGTAGYSLGRIGSGQIITTSIVAQSGNVETYRGDSYEDIDGRAIDWTDIDANWPDLDEATITVIIGDDVSFTGSVVIPSGANKRVRLELTAEQSLTIPAGTLDFVVRAVLANDNVVTLVDGIWISHRQLIVGS